MFAEKSVFLENVIFLARVLKEFRSAYLIKSTFDVKYLLGEVDIADLLKNHLRSGLNSCSRNLLSR